jgi:hypothetical protein
MPTDPRRSEENHISDTNVTQRLGSVRHLIGVAVVVLVLGLVTFRIMSELNMMRQHGPDAQMGIWVMFFLIQMIFWSFSGGTLAVLLYFLWARRWAATIVVLLLLTWSIAISHSAVQYQGGARALADAADPTTSSDRLHQLVHFRGIQAGYQLDNRIAAHPNTTVEDLRALHQRGQLGTDMTLAANPNTPPDILELLLKHQEIWVVRRLADNPNLPEHIRPELKDHHDEVVRQRLARSHHD